MPQKTVILALILMSAASFAAESYLIRLYYDGDPARLTETSFIPYAAYDDYAVGEVSVGYSRILQTRGFRFDVIAEDPTHKNVWQTNLAVAALPATAEVSATLAPGTYIVTTPRDVFLPGPHRTLRLHPTVVDFDLFGRASTPLSFTPNDDVREVVAAVRRSTFEDYVNDLAAFQTRYSYSPHCKEAADFIEQELTAAGYRVTRDRYFGSAIRTMAAAGLDVAWAAGAQGIVMRTTDRGATWEAIEQPVDSDALSIAATSADDAWVGFGDGIIMATHNGGVSWAPTILSDDDINGIFFLDATTGWAVDDWGGVYRTLDGQSWEKTASLDAWLWSVTFSDDRNGIVTGSDGFLARTTDGGDTWQPVGSPPDVRLYNAAYRTPTEIYVVGEAGTFLHSTDRGQTWHSLHPAGEQALYDVAFYDGVGVVVGPGGAFYRTTDGLTWKRRSAPPFFLSSAAMGSAAVLWCGVGSMGGSGGTLLFSGDGGVTWEDQAKNADPDSEYVWDNILARKDGGGDGTVLVTAHYDSTSDNPLVSAPGAEDNGTGTSAVLTLARACRGHDFRRDLLFVLYSGEEQRLLGSEHLAPTLAYEGEPISGVINPDMIAYQDILPEDGNLFTSQAGAWLIEYQRRAIAEYVPGLPITTLVDSSYRGSDHSPYWNFGYAASLLIDDDRPTYPYYHKVADTPDKLDFAFGTLMAKAVAASAASLASPTSAPVTSSLADVEVYPNPYRYAEHGPRVYFANLPADSRVTFYTIAGEKVAEEHSNGEDVWSFNMGQPNNARFPSGVLLYHIETPAGEKKTGKLAVIR